MISSIRSVCCTSSGRHASPVTTVMPSTFAIGDCSSTIIAIWSDPPGPAASWSMITIRGFFVSATLRPKHSRAHASHQCSNEDSSHSLSTHVSFDPPPCELFTTSDPFLSATRVNPPGTIVTLSPYST